MGVLVIDNYEKKTQKIRVILTALLITIVILSPRAVNCNAKSPNVKITTLVRSIEKIDLASSTFRIDFYLIIEADLRPSADLRLEEVLLFEFANGEPTIRIIEENIEENKAELSYRITGDFVSPFELGWYPFDRHNIAVLLDFMMATNEIIIETSTITNQEMIIVGWNLEGIDARQEYLVLDGETEISRFVLEFQIERPLLSTILKNIIPITVISSIALLTFLISPNNPSERIGLGVSTLLSATAFHLSLLGGIPPTSEFTIADGIMLSVYLLHFYSLLTSVYLMRLKDDNDLDRAELINKKAIKFLPVILFVPIAFAVLINL